MVAWVTQPAHRGRAPEIRRAEDSLPYRVFEISKLIRVREFVQHWIVLRRTEIFDQPTKDWIQQRIGVPEVQVKSD